MNCDYCAGEGRSELKFEIQSRVTLLSEALKQHELLLWGHDNNETSHI